MNILKLITPNRHNDHRGFFEEIYSRKKYLNFGIDIEFVQDNKSVSSKEGTLRGLHFQAPPYAQAKLIRCERGSIFDVAVDIRRGSPTFGEWKGYKLTAANGHQLFVPKGFAHGFMTLEPNSEISYKCSDYYMPETEGSILWSDPSIAIDWPTDLKPYLSKKDASAFLFSEFVSPFIFGENS